MRDDDVLVVYKLDRLGRTTKQLITLFEELKEKGIGFQAISNRIDTTTWQGKFFFTIMVGFSEMESELNRERTYAGLATARTRGRINNSSPLTQDILKKRFEKSTQLCKIPKPLFNFYCKFK